ncbi:MAG: galactarate dehydratase [Terriglobia bacterium]
MPSKNFIAVKIDGRDNVAIIASAEGVKAGAEAAGGLRAIEAIPQSHKIALTDLGTGEPVLRYGSVIGYANRPIARGSWVREDAMRMPAAPPLDELALATAIPEPLPPLDGYTFDGYLNGDGSVGTRNILGITTTVQCVAPTVDYAVGRIRNEILPRFRNVDDVVAVTHTYGCGVAIDAPGAAVPIRTIANIGRNPNFGGTPLIVSLGCEKMQPARLISSDLPVLENDGIVRLQDERGFMETVSAIMRAAERRLEIVDRRRRTVRPAADLIVGLQCGGSDAFSGVTCNPAVGFAADLLVRAGATVLFSEVTEVRDAVHLLTPRAATKEIALELIREMRWYDEYLAQGMADRSANTTPGNKRGGLSNIVEKSLGSVVKAGTTALRGVASHGEKVTAKGLIFAATPASDFVCGTLQLASMNLHVFTTGEGSPYGLALVPVLKISSRTALAEKWPDLIDLDAGTIATGQASISDVGWELFRLLLDVASGRRKTWAEQWRLHNALALFNPGPVT